MRARLWIAVALLAAQAGVLMLALFAPRAAPAYRAVYLDHTRDCWLADPARRPDLGGADIVAPRALPAADRCALLPKGWSPPDAWGVWSNGPLARLAVPLRPGDTVVSLRLRGYAPGRPQHVAWSSPGDGGSVSAVIPAGATLTLTIPVTPQSAAAGLLGVALRIGEVHASLDTDVADWRAIGVALLDVTRRGAGIVNPAPARQGRM